MKKMGSIILAAGDGKRMKSSLPKMLHRAAGKPLVEWVVEAAEQALGVKPIVVYGAGGSWGSAASMPCRRSGRAPAMP